jgi:hypothetical protein
MTVCLSLSRVIRPAHNLLAGGEATGSGWAMTIAFADPGKRQGQGLDVNNLLYRRIHLDLRRTASSACLPIR